MIARVLWIALLLAVAAVSSFAQLDRAARFAPQLAALVPPMFRGFAQAELTEMALVQDDNALALVRARRLAAAKLEQSLLEPLVIELTQTAAGRAALARRLAEQGHWQGNFVPAAANYLPASAYADLIVRARTLNAPLECAGLRHGATALQNAGESGAAARFWPGDCPAG